MKKHICTNCSKELSNRHNLSRHKKNCKDMSSGPSKPNPAICDNIINKIINGSSGEPSKKRRKPNTEIAKETLPEGLKSSEPSERKPNEKLSFMEIAKLYLPKEKKTFLPGDDEGLKEKLRLLYAEFLAGNKASTRLQIESILRELRHRGIITKENYQLVSDCLSECLESSESDSESSDSDSEQDEADELDFDNLVKATIQNLTRNDRQNVYNMLGNNPDVQESIDKYLKGENEIEEFTNFVDKLDKIRLTILLNNMSKTTKRVRKILNSLRSIDDKERIKVLDQLRSDKVISEPEFHRLLTSNNNDMSFAKAIQGSGIWV